MTDITLTTTLNDVPVNGLVDDPEITITRLDTDVEVISDTAMTDVGARGLWKYNFTPLTGVNYSFLIDADPNDTGQVDVRHFDGVFNSLLDEAAAGGGGGGAEPIL